MKPVSEQIAGIIDRNADYIRRFCNTSEYQSSLALEAPDKAMTAVVTGVEMYLPLAGLIDIAQEITRLEKEIQHLNSEVERVEKKLNNPGFVTKAPEKVIEEERAKLADYSDKRSKVIARIEELRG